MFGYQKKKSFYSRAKNPDDAAVPQKGGNHQYGVDKCQNVVPVFVDSGEVPPVVVNHVLMFLGDVPAQHVLDYLLGYPGGKKV